MARMKKRRRPAPPPPPERSRRLYVRVAQADLARMKFLLEAVDNLAYMSVIDRFEAVVQVVFSPHQEAEVRAFLDGLATAMPLAVWDMAPGRATRPPRAPEARHAKTGPDAPPAAPEG
ncbi:MAG: DUF4911 domain-containing protein [Desulfovibrionaceae bacterium]